MNKRIVLLSALLLCFAGLTAFPQDSPTQLEIKLAQTTVKNNEDFSLSAIIHNTGNEEKVIRVWSCGHSQWTADNPSVLGSPEVCAKNILLKERIKPGESGHWEVPVRVVLLAGGGQPESVTFRLGFQSSTYGTEPDIPRIWSNAVTVKVTR